VVTALQNFGTLSGWGKENHNDGFQNFKAVPTWDLHNATYSSPYVQFSDKEVQNHEFQPLDKFEGDEQAIIDKYNPQAKWPWLYINGQYAQSGSGYSPGLLQGQAFDDVQQQLASGAQNEATQAIKDEARLITHYICRSTGGQPEATCTS
jgi:hypothetical protein